MAKIVTLTLNPALDVSTSVDAVAPDRKLRCAAPRREPGGGGINVARAAHILGEPCTAVWTRGGHTGRRIGDLLDAEGVAHHPVDIAQTNRESLMVYEESSGQQYRFQLPGPELADEEIARLEGILGGLRPRPAYVVMSGSLPAHAPDDLYTRLAATLEPTAKVLVDTSGPALRRTAERGVFLIKPNLRELGELTGEDLHDDADIERAGRRLLDARHAEVIAVSLGAAGAVVVTRRECTHLRSPTVPIRSKVGAGDSMVAGIAVGLARELPIVEAVRFGVAAGAAAVMTPGSELCRREDTERLYESLR